MPDHAISVGVVVPEYRTAPAPGGGVASVADFFVSAVEAHRPSWRLQLISPRMWHRAPESRRIADARTWRHGPTTSTHSVRGRDVAYVGSNWSEIEYFRYRPRKALDALVRDLDAVVVVTGTPAFFSVGRRWNHDFVGQVATTTAEERKQARANGSLFNRLKASVNGALAGREDLRGSALPAVLLVENLVMREWCEANSGTRVELLPPGVDLDRFRPSGHLNQSSPPYVLSVGRLADPRKNIGGLIRAYGLAVTEMGLEHQLILAGNQAPPPDSLSLIDSLGLSGRVQIMTGLTNEELVSVYQGADIFAMSSQEEGLGLVMVEAIACGVPVVSTRTAGADFILRRSGAGRLVDFGPGVERRLAGEIATLAFDRSARDEASRSALSLARRFSADTLGLRFVEQVESLIRH